MTAPRNPCEPVAGMVEITEDTIRRRYSELANAAVERQRQWESLSESERHVVTCYAQQFGRRCTHAV